MAFPWLSLWDRTLDLRKVQRLSGETFKGWINLLCLANRQEERGRLPCMADIAYALRIDDGKAQSLIDELVESNLIDKKPGKILIMHDWESHQQTGKTSADRSREWREQKEFEALSERSASAQEALSERPILDKTIEDKKTKTPRAPRRGGVLIDFVLPEWIPENDWNDWLAMRRAKRAPTTIGAMVKAVKDLDKLRADGHPPSDVLQQSVLRAWTGVFPIAQPYHNGVNGKREAPKKEPQATTDEEEEKNREAYRRKLDY